VPETARIQLRDATLREGLDTPGVRFSPEDGVRIARALAQAGVPEAEVVAPARVLEELPFAHRLREERAGIRTSGLIYAAGRRCREEIEAARASLDRFDLLMPLSAQREPRDRTAKQGVLFDALRFAKSIGAEVGAGFPHSTQVEADFLCEIAGDAARQGAARITIYDTNGSGDPFAVYALIERLFKEVAAPLFFHGHNDLGMATANSLAAVLAGAAGLDVTVNGLGDRAGNASLEQVVMALRRRDRDCGVDLSALGGLSRMVEELSRVPVSKLAPVVGEFVFTHKSPGHLGALAEFEAFDPAAVGQRRTIDHGGEPAHEREPARKPGYARS
jgi:homocitrate synthase NifV